MGHHDSAWSCLLNWVHALLNRIHVLLLVDESGLGLIHEIGGILHLPSNHRNLHLSSDHRNLLPSYHRVLDSTTRILHLPSNPRILDSTTRILRLSSAQMRTFGMNSPLLQALEEDDQ